MPCTNYRAGFGWLASLMLAGGIAYGQSAGPASGQREFDVVSVKPYTPAGTTSELCNSRGNTGMFTRTGCTVEQLVRQAYALKSYQVRMKGPAWISSDRYVIQARLTQPATPAEMLGMLQPLLASRFQLRVHWENRNAPIFLLQVAAHGLKLSPATATTNQCGAISVREGMIQSDCVTMADIADVLEQAVVKDRPVLNRTGLGNDLRYKINLEFSPGLDAVAGASIFSALPDQLGLALKAGKAPLRTLVVDRAQRPEPN